MDLREKIAAEIRVHGKALGLWTESELARERAKPATEAELASAGAILNLTEIKEALKAHERLVGRPRA